MSGQIAKDSASSAVSTLITSTQNNLLQTTSTATPTVAQTSNLSTLSSNQQQQQSGKSIDVDTPKIQKTDLGKKNEIFLEKL